MIVNEPFLINPPKKKRRVKKLFRRGGGGDSIGSLGKMHRPLVFGPPSGPWRRSHRSKRRLAKLINPIGESLMIAGANPHRRKHRNKKRSHSKTMPHLFGRMPNPFSRHRSKRRRYNPMAGVLQPINKMIGYNLPSLGNLVGAGTGVILTAATPRLAGMADTPWKKYGVELATVLGGGFVFNMIPSKVKVLKGFTTGYIYGGFAWIVAELARQYVLPHIPGMSSFQGVDNYTPSLPAFGPGYHGYEGELAYEPLQGDMGAMPLNDAGLGESGFGAFPELDGGYETSTPFIPAEGATAYGY